MAHNFHLISPILQAMSMSVPQTISLAMHREIEKLQSMKIHARLAGVAGHMIHALQSERGAPSIFLASAGQRFENTRKKLIEVLRTVEDLLRETIRTATGNRHIVILRKSCNAIWEPASQHEP